MPSLSYPLITKGWLPRFCWCSHGPHDVPMVFIYLGHQIYPLMSLSQIYPDVIIVTICHHNYTIHHDYKCVSKPH